MGTPRPWGSTTLGTATAAGGARGVNGGTQQPDRETRVCVDGRVTDEGGGDG